MLKINTILFDFGGCLDSDGMHSRTLFKKVMSEEGLLQNRSNTDFQEAYTYADKKIINESLALECNLEESNLLMIKLIADHLKLSFPSQLEETSGKISSIQASFLQKNRPTLENLRKSFRLGIISNFSGNLHIILKQHHLFSLFECVLDSFHVGYSKPDKRIFEEMIKTMALRPQSCLFVGDNLERDIAPAQNLGMLGILIHEPHSKTQTDTIKPYASILEVCELLDLTQKI